MLSLLENGEDLNNWTMDELKDVVGKFEQMQSGNAGSVVLSVHDGGASAHPGTGLAAGEYETPPPPTSSGTEGPGEASKTSETASCNASSK